MSKVNSENYWDSRFQEDWCVNNGDKQSIFFMNLLDDMLPTWLRKELEKGGLTICDWGCAGGDGTEILAKKYPRNEFVGIDFADSAIRAAQSKYNLSNLTFLTDDYTKKNGHAQYDIVLTSNVLEHFKEPWVIQEGIRKFASKYFIMMVPFQEDPENLIPEHFHSFDTDDFKIVDDSWRLVHASVANTATTANSYWGGKQILAIYAQEEFAPNNLESITLEKNDPMDVVREYREKLDLSRKKIDELNEILQLNQEKMQEYLVHINTLWEHLHERRFVYADKAYHFANRLFPRGSSRRVLVRAPYRLLRYIRHTPDRVHDVRDRKAEERMRKLLLESVARHKSVIVYISMPWDNIMRQRPHHLAEKLSDLGHMIVYMDYEAMSTRKINDNLFIVAGDWCIDEISKIEVVKKFFLLPAGYSLPYSTVSSIVNRGYELIYEYIDELDETISGSLENQKEVFLNLKKLKPVLIIASAKKLYDEMVKKLGSPKRVIMSANAVDMSHFNLDYKWDKNNAPEDLKPIIDTGKPIVGYYGAIAPWLDYELINSITEKRRDLSFVFIGVNYNDGQKKLIHRDNVFMLGAKNYSDLPSYSYWFDTAIIPFQKGEIAKSTSPVKLFEYMAMGLPTVCTFDLRECYGYEYVYISKDTVDFDKNIDLAISMKSKKRTQKALHAQAMRNTWQARAAMIAEALNNIVEESK